jgi:UPF0042 nucleotide-binding protein
MDDGGGRIDISTASAVLTDGQSTPQPGSPEQQQGDAAADVMAAGQQQADAAADVMATGPQLVIITGMSGAGRTEAMHTLEDLGYFCIDNLPPRLLPDLVSLSGLTTGSDRKLAVVCDLRSREFFSELAGELGRLHEHSISYQIIFLDSTDETLLTRFKESRRRHPLCEGSMTITAGISAERELLVNVREMANFVVDTSRKESRELRKEIRALFSQQSEQDDLRVSVFSFGFKHTSPYDADIVIDVRFLPNPFYDPSLRELTGLDARVKDFIFAQEQTREFLRIWRDLLRNVMPGYVAEGKRYLSIGIGCTGGQHRSVAIAEETGSFLVALGYSASVSHRDLARTDIAAAPRKGGQRELRR